MRAESICLTIVAAAAAALFVANASQADELVIPKVDYPTVAAHAAGPEGFTPKGWTLEKQVTGDLNADGKPDLVMVFREADPKNVIDNSNLGPDKLDTNPRILAVAFATAGGGYDLALQNHSLIPRDVAPNMDDYLSENGGVTAARGLLKVALYQFSSAGSWSMGTTTYTFRWQHGQFEAIGYDNNSVQRNTGEMTDLSINYSTGMQVTKTGRIDSDKTKTGKAVKAPHAPVLTFDAIGDGLGFDPTTPGSPGSPMEE